MNYRTLVALFITVASLSAQAEQRWFEVELLIFERNAEIDDINEHLSSDKISIDTENSISLLEPIRTSICIEGETCLSKENPTIITGSVFDSEGNNFQRLDKSRLQLVKQREKLQRHASFEPVFHMAWRMPVKGPQASKPIHLFAGENLAFNIQKRLLENISLQSSDAVATELSDGEAISLITDKWAIDGNFKVYLNHYLFIDTQLVIRKEITEDIKQPDPIVVEVIDDENGVQIATQSEQAVVTEVKQQTVIKEILFDQNRRLRSEEVHYLDHPLMGIIVQIRKIPKVERKEEL
ncbi:MAG: hypothetical protein GY951_05880 [Psychromonas sp.]|nr:hypothetical protein [Psychromonas sp.]